MRETPMNEHAHKRLNMPDLGRGNWFTRKALLPEAGAAGTPLTAVIAVMCFLASMALAGFFVVNSAANDWTDDLRSSITVQVRGTTPEDIATQVEQVLIILEETDGVTSAVPMSRLETEALLKPYFGASNLGANIPVPGIIAVTAAPALLEDLGELRRDLNSVAPGAVLDDHGFWKAALAGSARTLKGLVFLVFLLVLAAACAVIIFAARAGMAANKEIISVLHLVGATDDFIASEVQRRFLILGLRGAAIGVSLAAVVLFFVLMAMRKSADGGAFVPSLEGNYDVFFWLLIVPVLTALISAFTARVTTLRALKEQF